MTSRLTVGVERLDANPPRGNPPCTEPVKYGTNVLRDPGLELQAANTGVGPNGDQLPEVGGSFPWEWWKQGGNEPVGDPNPAWVADFGDYATPRRWYLSTADPRSGTYHARAEGKASVDDGTGEGDRLYPMMFVWCDGATYDWQWGGRVVEGDYTRFGCWAKTNTLVGSPGIKVTLSFYDHAGASLVGSSAPNFALTTAYAWYETSLFVPPDAYYIYCYVSLHSASWADISDWEFLGNTFTADVDDFVLQVSK